MTARSTSGASAAEAILDAAERRAQALGFHGFSYADVAAEIGVTAASLHYHFPSKADLGVRLIERYTNGLLESFKKFEHQSDDPWDRLQAYAGLYEALIREDKLCLCCMLAAELQTLPPAMQDRLQDFFRRGEDWVAEQVRLAQTRGAGDDPGVAAAAIIGALQGAALLARTHGGVEGFSASVRFVMESFRARLTT